jgi:hypothetical protein
LLGGSKHRDVDLDLGPVGGVADLGLLGEKVAGFPE